MSAGFAAIKTALLNTTLNAGIGIIVALVGQGLTALIQHQEKVRQSAEEAANTYQESSLALNDQVAKYKELKAALEETNGDEEAAYSIKKQLYELQQNLTATYGDQAKGLDLVNGSLETQLGLLGGLSAQEAGNFLTKDRDGIKKAEKEMTRERNYILGMSVADPDTFSSIQKIVDQYEAIQAVYNDTNGEYQIRFTGDVTQAREQIQAFATDIRKLQDEHGENHALDNILGFSGTSLSDANSVLEDYGQIYKEALAARLVEDDDLYTDESGTSKMAAEWLQAYAQAVQAYNDALLTDDQAAIDETRTKYEALGESIEHMAEDGGKFSTYSRQFEEVSSQLNEAAANSNKFKEALSGDLAGSMEQLKDLKPSDLLGIDPEGDTAQAAALDQILEKAREYGFITEDNAHPMETLINSLTEWGMLQGEVTDETAETAQTMEELAEASAAAQNSITKAQGLLASQSTGKSISAEDLSSEELKDYADALEYVNGSYQLNEEKTRELIKAKIEEQAAFNDASKAQKQTDYLKNAREIEELTEKLRANSSGTDDNAAAIQNKINRLQESNNAIIDECRQIDLLNASLRESTGVYQEWLDAQNGPESGDMFSDSLGAIQAIRDTADKDSEDYGRIGTQKYKAALEFVIPDSVDRDDEAAVQEYLDSISDLFTLEDGAITGLDIDAFREKSLREGLMVEGTEEDGEKAYSLADGVGLEDFARGLGLSQEMVQAMFGEMQEFGDTFEWPQIDTLGDGLLKAEESIQSVKGELESLREQQRNGQDVDESAITELEAVLGQLEEQKAALSDASTDNLLAYADLEGQLETAQGHLERWKTELDENPADLDIQAKTDEAEQKVEELQARKNNLQEPTLLEIQLASDDISAKIEEKRAEIARLSSTGYLTLSNISPAEAQKEINRINAEIADLEGNQKTIALYAETSGATKKLEEINDYELKDKNVTVSVLDNATATLGIIQGFLDGLSDKNINVSVNRKDNTSGDNTPPANDSTGGKAKTPASGPHNASGNFRRSDAAHADGIYDKSGSHTALVGELGREIVVDVRSGRWHTVGDNGAEFVEIPAGAIVFNHLQTEQLLERGFVHGRGTALAAGNANRMGRAYGSGSKGKNPKTFQAFDWATVSLQYFADKTKKIADTITEYVTKAFKKTQLDLQVKALEKELSANNRGAKEYQKKADSVTEKYISYDSKGKKSSKSDAKKKRKSIEKYQKRVREGNWSIQDMDTSSAGKKALAEAIQSYQDYYHKAQDCKQAVIDLRNEQYGLFEELMGMPTETAEAKIDRLNDTLDILGARYENLASASDKNKNLDTQAKNQKKIRDAYAKAYNDTKSNLDKEKKDIDSARDKALKGLKKKDKETVAAKVNAHEEITIKDSWSDKAKKAATEYNIALRANREAYVNAEKAAEEYTKTLRDNTKAQFENIQAAYENKQKEYSQREAGINSARELAEAKGYRASSRYYTGLAENEKKLRASLLEERKKLQEQFDSAVNSGSIAKYSDEWYGMKGQIDEVTNAIAESDIALQGFTNSIRELAWENFEKLQDKISSIADEADFYIHELSREDLAEDDIGKLTERGNAVMKLHAVNYEIYRAQAKKYADGIREINGSLAKDPANEVLLEKKEEYIQAQRESAKAAEDEKYAMIDLAKKGYEAQKGYLQKVIDKHKKLLDIQKDANGYQKTLSDAMKEINAVQKQLTAISGDNSEASRAKRQELTASLKEKQDALKDKQLDKLTSDINDMFDGLMDNYSDSIDGLVKGLSENFGQLMDTVNANAASANRTVLDISDKLGLELQGLKNIFSGGESGNVLAATQTSVKNIEEKQETLVANADQIAKSLAAAAGGSNSQGASGNTDTTGKIRDTILGRGNTPKETVQETTLGKQKQNPVMDTAAPDKLVNMNDVGSYIKKHVSKANKKKSEYSDFNKAIYDNKAKLYSGSGKVLSTAEMKALAKIAGVKYDNATKKGALYKKFKELGIKGFAAGSRRIPYDQLALTQEKGPEMITLPDGSMLTPLKAGSKVFDDKMTENLWKISQDENVLKMFKETALPGRNDGLYGLAKALNDSLRYGAAEQNTEKIEIHFGDIHLPNVQNPEQFSSEIKTVMKNTIKNDIGMQKLLEGVTVSKLGRNYNSLSIRKY